MNEQPRQAGIDDLREQHEFVQSVLAHFKATPAAAIVEMAKTPDGREELVAMRTQFSARRLMLAASVRELAEIDRMLNKALRKGAGRFLA